MATVENLPLYVLQNAETALTLSVEAINSDNIVELMVQQLKNGLGEAQIELDSGERWGRKDNWVITRAGEGFILVHPRRKMSAVQELAYLLHASGHFAWEHFNNRRQNRLMEPNRTLDLIFGRLFRGASIQQEAQAENWARSRIISGLNRSKTEEGYMALHLVMRELEFQSPVPGFLIDFWD